MKQEQLLKKNQRNTKGENTYKTIVEAAMDIASIEGLEGISIGNLASKIGMSKSGLFAHFGSKESLQLAIVDEARKRFFKEVIAPVRKSDKGLVRFWELCDSWLSYLERRVFQGGCFFAAASAEFDSRSGPIHDKLANTMAAWRNTLKKEIEIAQTKNQVKDSVNPDQLAFETIAMVIGANWAFTLYNDRYSCNQARIAILNRLKSIITEEAPSLPTPVNYR